MTSPGRIPPASLGVGAHGAHLHTRLSRQAEHLHAAPRHEQSDLLALFEALGQAVVIMDRWGRVAHLTGALRELLESEPDAGALHGAMQRSSQALFSPMVPPRPPMVAGAPEVLRTASGSYMLRACLHASARGVGSQVVFVAVERLPTTRRTRSELRAMYALTEAEVEVTMLLALGRSNAQVADARGISPHTARRHTERILHKLGVRSRAEVARRIAE